MTNTHDTDTGLPSSYGKAAIPATISSIMETPADVVPAEQVINERIHAINVLDERVRRGVNAVRRQMYVTYSAAVAAGKLLTEFKAAHPRDYGKSFPGSKALTGHIIFSFVQQTAARYCRYYRDAWEEAKLAGCEEEMEAQLDAYLKGGMEAAPIAATMMERAKASRMALQELGALPAPPAPTLGERLDNAEKQGELNLSWEEKHTRAWTKWGGCCEQLETYITTSAAILTKTDREAAAARLEDMAAKLRNMPVSAASRMLEETKSLPA